METLFDNVKYYTSLVWISWYGQSYIIPLLFLSVPWFWLLEQVISDSYISVRLAWGMFLFCIASMGMTCTIFISRIKENTIEMPSALFPLTFLLQIWRASLLLIKKDK